MIDPLTWKTMQGSHLHWEGDALYGSDKEATYTGKMPYMTDKEATYTGKEMPYMTDKEAS